MELLLGKLMINPPADEEQVNDALNVAGSKVGNHHLKSHGRVTGGVAAMNC